LKLSISDRERYPSDLKKEGDWAVFIQVDDLEYEKEVASGLFQRRKKNTTRQEEPHPPGGISYS